MQEQLSHQQSTIIKQSKTLWYVSIGFAGLIATAIVAIFAYTIYLSEQTKSITEQVVTLNADISTIATDRNILVAEIIQNNTLRPSIDVKTLVTNFRVAARQANVRLNGFSVQDDVISTSLTATEGDAQIHPDPASTIIKMMSEYSKGTKTTFALEPITTLGGDDTKRTTSVMFRILPVKK